MSATTRIEYFWNEFLKLIKILCLFKTFTNLDIFVCITFKNDLNVSAKPKTFYSSFKLILI